MRSKRVAHHVEILAPGLGDDQALALAVEQLEAELLLQRLDLVADRALRDEQLLGGAREALVPRGGLEGLQCVERRQARAHRDPDFMRKTKAGRETMLCGQAPRLLGTLANCMSRDVELVNVNS